MNRISVCDDKYLFFEDEHGTLRCTRNGEPWRDFLGDKAVSALFTYCLELENPVNDLFLVYNNEHSVGIQKNLIGNCYKHYKGNIYKIIGFSKHSETLEVLVLYQRVDGDDKTVWSRPFSMFFEMIEMPRFKKVNEDDSV